MCLKKVILLRILVSRILRKEGDRPVFQISDTIDHVTSRSIGALPISLNEISTT